MDEIALIQEATQGNLDAFNRLVLFYQDMVYTQAFRMLGEQESAEDSAQEAFISAYKNLRSFRGGSFKAWLLRIVTNLCYDELRRRKRRPTQPLEPLDEDNEEIETPKWLSDPGSSPEEEVERIELSNAIQHCLQDLPEEFRSVVILVDIQGFDYSEASSTLGKPLGTIKSRLARARSRLQDCLRGFKELFPAVLRLIGEN